MKRQTGVRRPEVVLTSKDGQKVNVENYKLVALTMTIGKNPQMRYKKVSCEALGEVIVAPRSSWGSAKAGHVRLSSFMLSCQG